MVKAGPRVRKEAVALPGKSPETLPHCARLFDTLLKLIRKGRELMPTSARDLRRAWGTRQPPHGSAALRRPPLLSRRRARHMDMIAGQTHSIKPLPAAARRQRPLCGGDRNARLLGTPRFEVPRFPGLGGPTSWACLQFADQSSDFRRGCPGPLAEVPVHGPRHVG